VPGKRCENFKCSLPANFFYLVILVQGMNRLKNTHTILKRLVATMFVFTLLLLSSGIAFAQKTKVMVMDIKDEIDPRMTRYVDLALAHATETQADIVIIEMNTYGGLVQDAESIVDKLLKFKKPVWVFVDPHAVSAGALISIACDSIYMSEGANIGAATVVFESGEKAPDKYQSHMRAVIRATAEVNHRDPRIAEGMVEEDFAIEGIKAMGQIISFTTTEAIKHGYCEGKAASTEEVLKLNNITDYEIDHFELSAVDKVVAFFLNPFISGLLILVIIAGIYFEMQTPGMGFAGAAALVALILYLVPYYLNGIAENWEILGFFIGIALIAVEIFVIPGFGFAGIAGIIVTVGSLVLIMVNNNDFDFEFVRTNDVLTALAAAMGGLLGSIVLMFILGAKLIDSKFFNRVALADTQDSAKGYIATFVQQSMTGKRGIAHTVLRPSGKVLIDNVFYDAYSTGEYIEKGEPIEVVSHETTSLRVKKITA
jgi:membrane-bound serine protease (ClpP class)